MLTSKEILLKLLINKHDRNANSDYGISESMVRRWRRDQGVLFNGELPDERRSMGRYIPKYPELDQQLFEWFTEQRSQGENSFVMSVLFLDETKMK